jgi:hypothetical protein
MELLARSGRRKRRFGVPASRVDAVVLISALIKTLAADTKISSLPSPLHRG